MELYQVILDKLLQLPGSKPAGQDEIRMTCPSCKNPKSKLYVGLNKTILSTSGKKVLNYHCKHCPFSGGVGPKFLKLVGIDLDKNQLETFKFHKEILKNINPITKLTKLDIKVPNFIRPEDQFKVDYLSWRFGRKITLQDIKNYKIVLNFKDLYDLNRLDLLKNIDPNDKDYNKKADYATILGNEYTKHFVGLLSVDNNKINLRNINSERLKSKRYMVHVIDKSIGNPYMYMPDIPINLLTLEPTINIAEGNYDIIGAKELFYPNDDYSNVFVAIGTRSAYKRVLNQILKMTGFLGANINVFADDDVDTDIKWYVDMFKEIRPLFNKITLIYNKAKYIDKDGSEKPCKDFGVLSRPVKTETVSI